MRIDQKEAAGALPQAPAVPNATLFGRVGGDFQPLRHRVLTPLWLRPMCWHSIPMQIYVKTFDAAIRHLIQYR